MGIRNRLSTTLVGLVLAALLPTAQCSAQPAAKKGPVGVDVPKDAISVTLVTEDGVYLVGTYWKGPSSGKQTGIAVIPNIRTHTQRDWYPFAQALHEAGLAVFTFDFRGFGQSTEVVQETQRNKRPEGSQIRSEETTKSPMEIGKMLYDLDTVKQFLLSENNAEKLNVRQYGIVAVGDMASAVSLTWIASREHGPRKNWTREGGDIAALVLVSPTMSFRNFRTMTKFSEGGDHLPIFMISAGKSGAAFNEAEKVSRALRVPILAAQGAGDPKKEAPKVGRPGGWKRVEAKKPTGKREAVDLGIDLLRLPEYQDARNDIVGFLANRLGFKRETPWEGGRDIDQAFRIVSP